MTRVRLSDFSDIAAITWWTSLQDHLRDFQRVRDEMLEAQRLGLVIDDLELIAGAYNDAFMAMSSRYEAFKEAVRRLAPDAFTQLPLARCGDCLSIDPRQAALACELITSSPLIPTGKRSKPMSKKEALNYIGRPAHCSDERAAVDWFTRCISDGIYRCEELNRKTFVFHVDDFPYEVRKEIAQK
jgi:hypothetical protein